jgi:hypothetical protein
MRKITLIIAACAVVLLLFVSVIFWNTAPSHGPIKIAVAFSGFTNDVTGSRIAAFKVSNLGGVRLFRWPLYAIEESGAPSPASGGTYGRGTIIGPGKSSICLLPAPTNNVPWRAVLNFSADNWRRKFAGLPPRVRSMLQSRSLSLPVTECLSDWVGAVSPTPRPPATRERLAAVVVLPPSNVRQQMNGTAITPLPARSLILQPRVLPQQTNGTAISPPPQRQ